MGARAPRGCTSPSTRASAIHPQDDFFLDREVWDLSRTPEELRPLLLHYHPLVIYRFQVLKQADVVLALFLQGDRFTAEEKRKDFEYYDPITTGDSTLSAVVQSIIAAEVGYHEVAYDYFLAGASSSTSPTCTTTPSTGCTSPRPAGCGAPSSTASAACATTTAGCAFDPRLPDGWESLTFRITWRGTRVRVTLTGIRAARSTSRRASCRCRSRCAATAYAVDERRAGRRRRSTATAPGSPGTLGNRPQTGGTRADGSRITAGVPSAIPLEGEELPEPVRVEPSLAEPTAVGPD